MKSCEWLRNTVSALGLAVTIALWITSSLDAADPVTSQVLDIGSRRELFVDKFLIDRLDNATLKLHEPQLASPMAESADNLEYGTIIKDGDLFRLYTRDARRSKFDGDVTEVTRYCESRDGIVWTKPKLGLVEIVGNKDNNVILHEPWVCHNFSPFLDSRSGTKPKERFKALAGVHKGGGLVAFMSEDGIKWTRLNEAPVLTSIDFAFDSQNVSFWSAAEQLYVCYFRTWKTPHGELRTISRTTSQDFVHWTEPEALHPNFLGEHLYTSQTHPYFRAPHIYIALPTRFHPGRGASTDILFMSTRGSAPYDRTFREAFIRPGLDLARWGNRSNYAALNVVPTSPTEMSIYTTPFRRFVLRTDGFASVHAGVDSGELLTRPLRFEGKEFVVNYATSAGGSLRVEIQEESGIPIPGFSLAESRNLVGDAIEQSVSWAKGSDVSLLAGKTVRLRFVMLETDLFAIQFR